MITESSVNLIHEIGLLEPRGDCDFKSQTKRLISNEKIDNKTLTTEVIVDIGTELTNHFIEAAPDLKTFNLAADHISKLLVSALQDNCGTVNDLLAYGAQEFYRVGKELLGPLWASYTYEALSHAKKNDIFLFAARDSTPMYWSAMGLQENKFVNLDFQNICLVHVDWNRWFMAQEDELDESGIPLNFESNLLLKKFYEQMGFLNGNMVKIMEPGAWGSAANALKTMLPNQKFELSFMFSQMPEFIYGFLNTHCPNIDPINFEIINDTAEAVPKAYKRPTKLIEENGKIVADLSDRTIDSPYMRIWSWAVNQGALDAGKDFNPTTFSIPHHVEKIIKLKEASKNKQWTGILPRNTLTWTEGENWRQQWKWGVIPPLTNIK